MSPFSKLQLTCLLIALFGSSAFAQEKGAEQVPDGAGAFKNEATEAKVISIYESRNFSAKRNKFSGSLSVEVGIRADVESARLIEVEVTSAKDDKGSDLLDPKTTVFEAKDDSFTKAEAAPTARLRFELPAPEAATISEIKGVATFQDAAKAAKPVELTDFKKTPGEFLKNESLEKFGISIAYLDAETFDEKGVALMVDAAGVDSGEAPGEDEKAAFAPIKAIFQMGNMSLFVIKDPEGKFLKIEGISADGKTAFLSKRAINGLWMLISGDRKTDLEVVRIHVKSDEAQFKKEFVLRDVKLP